MTRLELTGRILFLCADPDLMDRQMAGAHLPLADVGALRNDVSTDEISPVGTLVYFDDRLARYPYTGLRAGTRTPIGVDAIKGGGFSVTVAGVRYGKGSSREHSPVAEFRAGIRLVIARSFERIYRQNADNQGLFTSTDFGLIERIERGDPIYVEELVASRDSLAAAILQTGGLLRYGQRSMRRVEPHRTMEITGGPLTLAEKIFARHAVRTEDTEASITPGTGVFVRADWRFIHEYYTAMAAHMLEAVFPRPLRLHDPTTIIAFEDHLSYAHRSAMHLRAGLLFDVRALTTAHREFASECGFRNHGCLELTEGSGVEGSEGISHPMMTEQYALPGQVVVGTDSHTPHSGSLGCIAFGVGTTDMANAFVTGAVRMTVPQSLRIDMHGPVPPGVTAKDLVLHLLAKPRIRAGVGLNRIFEFVGTAISCLSTDERATLTNMTAELGGFTGIVAPDAETVRFLRERRGIDFSIEPWMQSDPGADYAEVISLDCSSVSPMVAAPGDPGNGLAIADLTTRPRIDIAYGGSCTGGKRNDFDQYHEVLAWAKEHGLRVPASVELVLQFGTTAVRDYCLARGYLDTFLQVGATILQASCGACANCGPGSSTNADQVTVSAINRNFPGRSGPGQMWLASPATVAASAMEGEIVSFAELQSRHSQRMRPA
jgi:3-isopropylmalate/(R)-2-methylmalate dehydratase large subunit